MREYHVKVLLGGKWHVYAATGLTVIEGDQLFDDLSKHFHVELWSAVPESSGYAGLRALTLERKV